MILNQPTKPIKINQKQRCNFKAYNNPQPQPNQPHNFRINHNHSITNTTNKQNQDNHVIMVPGQCNNNE
eukprot:Pgem_evm1s3764